MKQKILITNLQWNVYQLEGRIVNQISGVLGLTVLVTQLLAPVSCVCVWHKFQMPENLWAPGTEGVMQSSMKFLPWQVKKGLVTIFWISVNLFLLPSLLQELEVFMNKLN